jgi:hypothetical protein
VLEEDEEYLFEIVGKKYVLHSLDFDVIANLALAPSS